MQSSKRSHLQLTTFAIPAIVVAALLAATPVLQAFADDAVPIDHHSRPIVKLKEGTSSNWSGYAAESSLTSPKSGFVNKVVGTWVIPNVSCGTTPTYSSLWVGIDGYSDGSVEQLGTEQDCSGGAPQYYAWYEMYPKPGYYIPITVKAGDTITASVTYSGGRFILSMQDGSTGASFSKSFKSSAQRSSAEWIIEAPYSGHILTLANFGTAQFTNSQYSDSSANGGSLHSIDFHGVGTYDAITMKDPYGGTSTPSGLTNSGTSFTATYSN